MKFLAEEEIKEGRKDIQPDRIGDRENTFGSGNLDVVPPVSVPKLKGNEWLAIK